MKLGKAFYLQQDVVGAARSLIGKVLVTRFDDRTTAGIITETEAYAGASDKASHAYGNRRTKRTETMFAEGGTAYVYLCYGIHHLFNVVTNQKDVPHAVLIRGVHPVEGIEYMQERRGKKKQTGKLAAGPGTLTEALGIRTAHDGADLLGDRIFIEDRNIEVAEHRIEATPRIGIDYAGEDALLPYRFYYNEF